MIEAAGPTSLVVGFIEESPRHRFYNAALWAEGGRVVHVHRKVYLPTYGLFDEQRYFAAGERFMAFDTARLGWREQYDEFRYRQGHQRIAKRRSDSRSPTSSGASRRRSAW